MLRCVAGHVQFSNPFLVSVFVIVWQARPFVKAGRAHALNERTWTFGGPLSALTLTGEISRALSGR